MKDPNCDDPTLFKDDKLSIGGQVKSKGEVLKEYFHVRSKTLDVAYGEIHPRQARDTDGPKKVELHDDMECLAPRRRRGASRRNIQQNTDENFSVGGDPEIVELPCTRTHSASIGCVASYGQSFLEAFCSIPSFVSKDAISLFRRMTSPVRALGWVDIHYWVRLYRFLVGDMNCESCCCLHWSIL
ncbi:uncharacterized protein LOC110723424 [Chenopodium quinoa]|uniref:uncharacterized protein LOC110723424 n=1 Tax=Chenopodium quinoa TaxID=63459 RepID=UPI000B784FCB|nr:uncharacterized protein LOC110723424 [Chenopodium quinoa]XP_021758475.1 uncharacterized protein LOC110723424 [Chenopodium quinoa]XP_021758476.1 uncharacterized protein LOC110723424 [Chenopodium quinoa]